MSCFVFLCLGVFLFGIFALMLFVDVTKLLIGRLRPDFLHTCRVNVALCNTSLSSGLSLDDSACLNTDTTEIRAARYARLANTHTQVDKETKMARVKKKEI